MAEPLTPDEIEALADAFPVGPSAVALLRIAGFPASAIRSRQDLSPLEFWTDVAHDISNGIMPDGRKRLLEAARRRFPANLKFADRNAPIVARVESARRVLIIGASPTDRPAVRTDRESRAIREAARPECLQVSAALGAESVDLALVRSARPDILHFTCHGENGQLAFNDAYGEANLVRAELIADTLRHYQETADVHLRGIVLAACDGDSLAPAFTNTADVVIGHRGKLDDKCGLAFARLLYERLNDTDDMAVAARDAAQMVATVDRYCGSVITGLIVLESEVRHARS